MRILCVSHSSRPFFEARTQLNYLEQRFAAPAQDLPPFAHLPGVDEAVPFSGDLSIWLFDDRQSRPHLHFLRHMPFASKAQSALLQKDRLLVLCSDRIQEFDTSLNLQREIQDPWLAGSHMILARDDDHAWVSAAPANAALLVSLKNGTVIERRRMPDRYGKGYALEASDDLRRHYVPTDLQPTHVNCAFPLANGALLVTLWIPGAVGVLEGDGSYREILNGLRGVHGARRYEPTGEIMVSDSAAGLIWFLDPATGAVRRRLQTKSRWLHDAEPLGTNYIAATIGDRNKLEIIDAVTGAVLLTENCDPFGASVMFATSFEADPIWLDAFGWREKANKPADEMPQAQGAELLPSILEPALLKSVDPEAALMTLDVERLVGVEPFLRGQPVQVPAGKYLMQGRVRCRIGGVSAGLVLIESAIEQATVNWVAQLSFDAVRDFDWCEFELSEPALLRLAIDSANTGRVTPLHADFQMLSLRGLEPTEEQKPLPSIGTDHPNNILPLVGFGGVWNGFGPNNLFVSIDERRPIQFEYLWHTTPVLLQPGRYHLQAEIEVEWGAVTVGLLNADLDQWVHQLEFSLTSRYAKVDFEQKEAGHIRIIIAGANRLEPSPVRVRIIALVLTVLDAEGPPAIDAPADEMPAGEPPAAEQA